MDHSDQAYLDEASIDVDDQGIEPSLKAAPSEEQLFNDAQKNEPVIQPKDLALLCKSTIIVSGLDSVQIGNSLRGSKSRVAVLRHCDARSMNATEKPVKYLLPPLFPLQVAPYHLH